MVFLFAVEKFTAQGGDVFVGFGLPVVHGLEVLEHGLFVAFASANFFRCPFQAHKGNGELVIEIRDFSHHLFFVFDVLLQGADHGPTIGHKAVTLRLTVFEEVVHVAA